jgi:hypothetical protein
MKDSPRRQVRFFCCVLTTVGSVFTQPRPKADKWQERCPGWDNYVSMPDRLIRIIAYTDLGDLFCCSFFVASNQGEIKMKLCKTFSALIVAACGTFFGQSAIADVIIPYNDYSGSPTIGRGDGTSTDPNNPGYGAMRIFIQKVMDYTDENGPDALPVGQKVIFQRDQNTGRAVNALTAGVQFANTNVVSGPKFSVPSWGFIYNSGSSGSRVGVLGNFRGLEACM